MPFKTRVYIIRNHDNPPFTEGYLSYEKASMNCKKYNEETGSNKEFWIETVSIVDFIVTKFNQYIL